MNIYLIGLLALASILLCGWLANRKRKGTVNMVNAANAPNSGTHADGRVSLLCGAGSDWVTFAAAYTADARSPKYAVVKRGADGDHIRISASATDEPIGVCTDGGADTITEDPLNVILFGAARGTVLMVAAAAIVQDEYVQSNGDGAVKTAVATGFVIGRTVTAAGAAGDVIEVIPMLNELAKA